MRLAALAIGAALAGFAQPALAQSYRCAVPGALPDDGGWRGGGGRVSRRDVAVTGYSLALSWSPQYCREHRGDAASAFQCDAGNRFGFVLHGLWPEGQGRDWPQYCRPVPRLSDAMMRRQLCTMPSTRLIANEWAKHGSCSGMSAASYFDTAGRLYGRLRYPDMDALSRRNGLRVGQLAAEIARVNPGLSPAMMRITTGRGGWLDEVQVCLDTSFRYRACPPGSGGAAVSAPVSIWRGGR